MMPNERRYSELVTIPGYFDRFEYVKLDDKVGFENPEVKRWLHQRFYHTPEWRKVRREVVIRDGGYDLAHPDRLIAGRVVVHHLNPITLEDIYKRNKKLLDPENLISVSNETHQAIHYGDKALLVPDLVERAPGDTKLW